MSTLLPAGESRARPRVPGGALLAALVLAGLSFAATDSLLAANGLEGHAESARSLLWMAVLLGGGALLPLIAWKASRGA